MLKIKFHENRFSGFESPNRIWIANKHKKPQSKYHGVIKHELSHIGAYVMTDGASYTNRFRFLDEGLADVLRNEKNPIPHRDICEATTKNFLYEGIISLELIMDWKTYFGDPYGTGTVDSRAYKIGSSFIYFIVDTFGKRKFNEFFKKININVNFE